MNKSSYIKIGLCLVAVFLAGAVTGSLATAYVGKKIINAALNPPKFAQKVVDRMGSKLDLTADQKARIQPIVEESAQQLRKIQLEKREEMQAAIEEAKEKILPVLNKDQQNSLQKMDDQRKARMNKLYE